MEDNSLWLRHLLNMVVQVVLALHVFWRSIGRHRVEILVSGIFVSVTGIIKYGERTWSLKCGCFESLESATGDQYKYRLPEKIDGDAWYSNIVCTSLHSMLDVLDIFASRSRLEMQSGQPGPMKEPKKVFKVLEVKLGMVYDDLYTKALVLRTRSEIILRFISEICMTVAFTLFLASDRQSYITADIAVTYSQFIGSFILEVCSVFNFMMSPWTWAWLKGRKYKRLSRFSWLVFSSSLIGCPEERPLWSNVVGQYNLTGWLAGTDRPKSSNQPLIAMVKRLLELFGAGKEKVFLMRKLSDTGYISAEQMMECLIERVSRFKDEPSFRDQKRLRRRLEWPNIGLFLTYAYHNIPDYGSTIVLLHTLTEMHMSNYPAFQDIEANVVEPGTEALIEVCQSISRYMMYLLVTNPSLLPLGASAANIIERWQAGMSDGSVMRELRRIEPQPCKEALEEIKEVWIRFLIYAANKSRPVMHAAQLARGGEPLTFIWLQLAYYGLLNAGYNKIEITRSTVRGLG